MLGLLPVGMGPTGNVAERVGQYARTVIDLGWTLGGVSGCHRYELIDRVGIEKQRSV
jgi:uncharacterized ParB-like nuclease family protein